MPLRRAETPFLFKTQLSLVEATGLKARDLAELSRHLKEVPEASVYHHTHHFLQQHQYLTPEPTNDFAYWVSNVLQEEAVGERLAAMDTARFNSLEEIRGAILEVLDAYLAKHPDPRPCPPGEEFYFMKCVRFNLSTRCEAYDLREFLAGLEKVSTHCLYYHVFEGRLREPLGVDDFSYWFETSVGEPALAKKISKLDPYTYTLEGLRKKIMDLVSQRVKKEG